MCEEKQRPTFPTKTEPCSPNTNTILFFYMRHRITNTNSLSLEDSLEPDADQSESENLGVPSDPIENVPWFLTHFDEHLLNQVSNHSLNPEFFFHANSNSTEKRANVARRWRVRRARRRTQFQDLVVVGTSSSQPRDDSVLPVSAERQRRCSHCSTTNTPQWRMGPNGPGTLCNACGIRYRSNPRPFL